ncbi:MAG: hypothetical protein WCR20_06655, partial [Verrucomicrobiota bacterium]
MRSKNIAGLLGYGALLVAGSPIQLYAQKVDVKPNILLIITDQQSSAAMSNRIGSRYLKTPNMDYLASHGITYTQAYCAN